MDPTCIQSIETHKKVFTEKTHWWSYFENDDVLGVEIFNIGLNFFTVLYAASECIGYPSICRITYVLWEIR